jgi:2-keto-4-pentenoate hydratase/2-oxohepta-3-ene-1,7-dioic acid hydratase in catechol pathway
MRSVVEMLAKARRTVLRRGVSEEDADELVHNAFLRDPCSLAMWPEVNAQRFQDGSSATMAYKPAFLFSYVSQFMSLQPGVAISTGTPPGVGMGQKPSRFLKGSDVMRLGIEKLGEQQQRVLAD